MTEKISHPPHYGGPNNPYEVIKVINAWDLGFNLGNVLKYVFRAGKKRRSSRLEDLKKACQYLIFEIEKEEGRREDEPTLPSHAQLLNDLHFFAWSKWTADKEPLSKETLITFLASKIPVRSINTIVNIAVESNLLTQTGDNFVPVPKGEPATPMFDDQTSTS